MLDFFFIRPVFRNSLLTSKSEIPSAAAYRFTHMQVERGILRTLEPSSGRRPAFYSFDSLLELVRE